ncbi:MAG TPA: hypothetical protein VF796_02225, partial [Humisphaera sp.]
MTADDLQIPPADAGRPAAATGGRATAGRSIVVRVLGNSGVWALADQAVCSGGNFLTMLIVARTLAGDPFGQYWLLLQVVQFLNGLHGAVVTYPLTLAGAAAATERFRQLVRRGLGFTLAVGPVLGLVVLAAAMRADRPTLFPWVAAAMVLWQAQETCRRALIARLAHRWAIPGDVVSFLGQAAGVWALRANGALTPESAFAVIAVTSGLAAAIQTAQILLTRAARLRDEPAAGAGPAPAAPGVVAEAAGWWRTGRWLLLTSFVNVGTVYLCPWVLETARGHA